MIPLVYATLPDRKRCAEMQESQQQEHLRSSDGWHHVIWEGEDFLKRQMSLVVLSRAFDSEVFVFVFNEIHPLIYLNPVNPFWGHWVSCWSHSQPLLAKAGYSLDGSPVHRRATHSHTTTHTLSHSHLRDNLDIVSLIKLRIKSSKIPKNLERHGKL